MSYNRHHFLMVAKHFARKGYATDGAVEGGGDDQQAATPHKVNTSKSLPSNAGRDLIDRALSVVPRSGSPLHEAVTLAQQHTRGRP